MALRGMLTFLSLLTFHVIKCENCIEIDMSTQTITEDDFQRDVEWVVETKRSKDWMESGCYLALHVDVCTDFCVSKDELAKLNSNSSDLTRVDGDVDTEAPAHETHIGYIFLERDAIVKAVVTLPQHLRYKQAQNAGTYMIIHLGKPSVLIRCPDEVRLCGKRRPLVDAPCDFATLTLCAWDNVTYKGLFDKVKMIVPVEGKSDYALVFVVTILLAWAGCFYLIAHL